MSDKGDNALTDWAGIEAAYRAGTPVAPLAESYGLCRQTVYKRARDYGWERDLSAVVAAARTRKLLRVPHEYVPPAPETAEQERLDAAVEQAAGAQVTIISAHQAAAQRLRECIARQIDELHDSTDKLSVRAQTARQLAASLSSVVDIERRAHGITDDGGETDSYEARLRALLEEAQP